LPTACLGQLGLLSSVGGVGRWYAC